MSTTRLQFSSPVEPGSLSDPPGANGEHGAATRPAAHQLLDASPSTGCGPPADTSIRAMLTRYNLEAYVPKFEDEGFDDPAFLLHLACTAPGMLRSHLDSPLQMKPGHAHKFMSYVVADSSNRSSLPDANTGSSTGTLYQPQGATPLAPPDSNRSTALMLYQPQGSTTPSVQQQGPQVAKLYKRSGSDASGDVMADPEAAAVWKKASDMVMAKIAASTSIHGWRLTFHLRGNQTNNTGDLFILTPEEVLRGGSSRNPARSIRSLGSLQAVLEARLAAKLTGVWWEPPSKGSTIEVEAEGDDGGSPSWRAAIVKRVLPDGRFQAHVHEADGSLDHENPFYEWFSQNDEGHDWRRRSSEE